MRSVRHLAARLPSANNALRRKQRSMNSDMRSDESASYITMACLSILENALPMLMTPMSVLLASPTSIIKT